MQPISNTAYSRHTAAVVRAAGEPRILAAPSPDEEERETVVRENDVDPLDMEQTFPTEEELREAEAAFNTKLRKKRVPKGALAGRCCKG